MNWSEQRVVITGGTGFIGSFLVEELQRRGAEVSASSRDGSWGFLAPNSCSLLQGDLLDGTFCSSILSDATMLIHGASLRKNVSFHHEHAQEVFDTNVQMSQNLANALSGRSDIAVVFLSTANIPPDADLQELSSSIIDGYVSGKAACERIWQQSSLDNAFSLSILRPVNVYGPRDRFTEDGNVIPSLIVKASHAEKELTVWGSGQQQRRFLYVQDLVRALCTLLDTDQYGMQYITPVEEVTIASLAQNICDLVSSELTLTFDRTKPEGRLSFPPFPSPPVLQDFSWTPLSEGLEQTIEWWRSQ